ncbi:hypothetical protein M0R04_15370 [Candidatus Dojkabacteria bacterium]|jgi:hypothetical protein|nr:hypothetical protein [Candidatus Dojkabacteria bacterium]
MTEYETKLSLDNSTEHLKTVLDNIRVANLELERVLRETQIPIEEKAKIELEIEELNKENDLRIKKGIDLEQYCIIVNNKVNLLLKQEKEINKRVSQAENKLNKINKDASISLSNYLKTIDAQNIVLVGYKNDITLLKQEIKKNEETNQEQSRVKAKQENELVRLNNKIEEAQKELSKFLVEADERKADVAKLIEDEKEKIKNPLELVKREQDKLENLKSDVNIIRRRLTEQFKKQNPKGILPIELQEK